MIRMTYNIIDIEPSKETLIEFPSGLTMYEMLGRIDQYRATGRYSEIFMDGSLNAIVGVIA